MSKSDKKSTSDNEPILFTNKEKRPIIPGKSTPSWSCIFQNSSSTATRSGYEKHAFDSEAPGTPLGIRNRWNDGYKFDADKLISAGVDTQNEWV